MTPEERTSSHLRENKRSNSQHDCIELLVKAARVDGHRLFIVIFPARKEYTRLLPPKDSLFNGMYELAKKNNLTVIDFYEDTDFEDDDFYDWDHLNENGARKLTKKLNNILVNL